MILGHGHPAVAAAVAEAAAAGTTFAMTASREIMAAERFKEAVGWVDHLRFTNTGTEATMHAIRLARAHTGRELVLKFEGTYHGAHDYLAYSTAGSDIGSLGSRLSPIPVQSSSGMPEAIRSLVRVAPFNDLDSVERVFRREGHQVAAAIIEPALGNAFGIRLVGPRRDHAGRHLLGERRCRGGDTGDHRRAAHRRAAQAGRGHRLGAHGGHRGHLR